MNRPAGAFVSSNGGDEQMVPITNVEDLRVLAKAKLPRALFDYIDSGAYDEVTKGANTADFQAIGLRQRVMADVAARSLETTILGTASAMPVVISPVGLAGLLAGGGNGEIFAARAAKAAGIPFGLSMLSIATIEEIRAATGREFWFHIMPLKDRGGIGSLMARAAAAGCPALIVTVDWQVPSQSHRNVKNGLSFPPRLKLRDVWQYLAKPEWLLRTAGTRRSRACGNLIEAAAGSSSIAAWIGGQLDAGATWEYIRWIREHWRGKLIVKGILDPRDAVEAVNSGADAVSVSNHGGTQLDGAPSAISMLPIVADAIAGRAEILFDSGIRSGQDVLKALASGARACLLGRPYLYALGAAGETGVATMLSIIRREMDVNLALTGLRSVRDVSPDILHRQAGVRHVG